MPELSKIKKIIFAKPIKEVDCPKKKENLYQEKKKSLVSKVKVKDFPLGNSIKKSLDLIGGLKKVIKKGDSVLVKANFNTLDEFPASTHPEFLQETIKLIQKTNPEKIVLGESSTYYLNTRKALEKAGILKILKKEGAGFVSFDEKPWYRVKLKEKDLENILMTSEIFNYDKIIYLPCLKTHHQARFSISLKLTVGFVHPKERIFKLHFRNLEANCAIINKAVYPDLIILDARKCFVTEGPVKGKMEFPNLILASGDRIALDAEGLKILLSYRNYRKENLLVYDNPFQYQQIRRAAELGLGVMNEKGIKVIKK